MINTAMSN